MTVHDWLTHATGQLASSGIGTARLDALVLLEDCLGKNRALLLAHPELILTKEQRHTLDKQLGRRKTHEPLAYIRGKTEFYGRYFLVDHAVLEPRPETETMIELLKKLDLPTKPCFVDVGTGSGAIAITTKLSFPAATVLAIDIDASCLDIAQKNARTLQAEVVFLQGNLLAPLTDRQTYAPNIILANLPYVPDNFRINEAAMVEPRIAIFGGPDGLDLYRQMFAQLRYLPSKPRYILTESLPPQHQTLADIALTHGYKTHTARDFIQVFSSKITA